jgi:hypothetical protein
MKKFYMADVPKEMTILQYIEAHSDLNEKISQCKKEKVQNFFEIPLPLNVSGLTEAYHHLKQKYGLRGWRTTSGEGSHYLGISLVYNANHQDRSDHLYSTLGSDKLAQFESFRHGQGEYTELKDSYYDTYSFNRILPEVKETFGDVFKLLPLTPIRSRISEIIAGNSVTTSKEFGWHLDEHIFHNLRVNIPLVTAPEYKLQIEGEDEFGNRMSYDDHLKRGQMYIWNTRIRHRVYATAETEQPRAHIVLGFSPWFHFDEKENCWEKNEFYGMHPLKLVQEELILNL